MSYAPFDVYLIAWDWVLWAGYWGLAIGVFAIVVPILFDVFFLPDVPLEQRARESRMARFADSLSQVLNVLLFNGDPNYSISGDAYRFNRRKTMAVANWLFRDPDHCRKAFEADFQRAAKLMQEKPVKE